MAINIHLSNRHRDFDWPIIETLQTRPILLAKLNAAFNILAGIAI